MHKEKMLKIIKHCQTKEQLLTAGDAMKLWIKTYQDLNNPDDRLEIYEVQQTFYKWIREFRRYGLWYYK